MAEPWDTLPPLRDVIARHGLRAEKKLGQNFLLDGNITDKIARGAGDLGAAHVIEIGPGPGGLTRSLLRHGALSVTAVEYDPRAVGALKELEEVCPGRLRIVAADALATDIRRLAPPPRAIVANLPYNIATPLLVGWLRMMRDDPGSILSMTLMFQKEVAERIAASKGGEQYSRLSVLCGWLCTARKLFDIPGSAFVPPPRVTSSVVTFLPKPLQPGAPRFSSMEKTTAAAFGQRRKMLRSSLKGMLWAVHGAGIDDSLRAEQLTVADFEAIAAAAEEGSRSDSA